MSVGLAQAEGLILLAMLGVPVLAVLVVVVGYYNGLVRVSNACDESWSGIDTELKRRYDLIPRLVETVKGYAKHERETLELVIRARNTAMDNHGAPESQARDENAMIGALRRVFALAEAYPELKANEHFLKLQKELATTENRIQRARRFYNANVRDLNNRVQMFPSSIIAGMFSFTQRDYFEIEDHSVREPLTVNLTGESS